MAAEEVRKPSRFARIRKILVIDQDAAGGTAIRLALEETGYYLNHVAEPREGCRRVMERAYDLIVVSASVGPGALHAILELVARRVTPPPVIVLAGPDELKLPKEVQGVPVSILHRPCAVTEVVDSVRALVGAPWTDHMKGA